MTVVHRIDGRRRFLQECLKDKILLLNFRKKGKLKKLRKLKKLKTYVKAQKTPERKRKDYCP